MINEIPRGDAAHGETSQAPHRAPLPRSELMPDARTLCDTPEEATRDLHLTRSPLRHPALLRASTAFGRYFLDAPLLPLREREHVALRVARLCRCEFVWGQHVALSRREGIPGLARLGS